MAKDKIKRYPSRKRNRNHSSDDEEINDKNVSSSYEDTSEDESEDEIENKDKKNKKPPKKNQFVVPDNYVEYDDGRVEITKPKYNFRNKKLQNYFDPYADKYNDPYDKDYSNDDGQLLDRIVDIAMDDEENISSWKKCLSEEEIEQLTPLFDNIISEFKSKDVNEVDIMKSDTSLQNKVEIYELLRVMRNELITQGETDTWLKMRIRLYDKIKSNPMTNGDQEIIKKLNEINKKNLSISHKIIQSKHPDSVKAIIYKRYCEIKNMKDDDETYGKTLQWIERALSLPTESIQLKEIYNNSSDLLFKVYDNMNKNLYGQMKVKERILDILSSMWVNPEGSNKSIVLVGPPGVGKTAFARSLAEGIGLPFYQISFGGAKDSSVLKGHSFTYIGSQPGEIVEGLINMKVTNGILFLDELDKIDEDSPEGRQVSNTLLHILDYKQNMEFKDNYMSEIPINLSNLIIVAAVNDPSRINSVLLDRLQLVNFVPYTTDDKITIGHNYTIPRVIKNLKIKLDEVKFTRNTVNYIINKSKIKENGVRQLERNIRIIFERINTLKQIHTNSNQLKKFKLSYDIKDFKLPFVLDESSIDILFSEFDSLDNAPPPHLYM